MISDVQGREKKVEKQEGKNGGGETSENVRETSIDKVEGQLVFHHFYVVDHRVP